jgi:hypothetical protein
MDFIMKAFQNEDRKHFPWQGNYLNCAYLLAIMQSLTISILCSLLIMKLTSHYAQYRCVLGLLLLIVRFHTLHYCMYRKIKQKIIFKK